MKNLMEKAERLVTTIFEIMEEEPEQLDAISAAGDDEPLADNVLHGQEPRKLMELCW